MLTPIKNITETLIFPGGTRHCMLPLENPSCEPLRVVGLSGGGMTLAPVGYSVERHGHSAHEVLCTLSGSALLHIPDRTFNISEGEVMVLPAGSSYRYQTDRGVWDILWFHLRPLGMWPISSPAEPYVRKGVAIREMRQAVEGLLSECARNDDESERLVRSFSEQIAAYLSRELATESNARDRKLRQRVDSLREAMRARLQHGWTVSEMAEQIHMSPAHVHRLCLRYAGCTPKQMLFQLRMQRAEELLLRQGHPLKNIAEELGYGSPFAFSNAFKRHKGISPERYRRLPKRR